MLIFRNKLRVFASILLCQILALNGAHDVFQQSVKLDLLTILYLMLSAILFIYGSCWSSL